MNVLENGSSIIRHADTSFSSRGLKNFILNLSGNPKYRQKERLNCLTIPLGPRVVLMRSLIAIAPTKEDWRSKAHLRLPCEHFPPFLARLRPLITSQVLKTISGKYLEKEKNKS